MFLSLLIRPEHLSITTASETLGSCTGLLSSTPILKGQPWKHFQPLKILRLSWMIRIFSPQFIKYAKEKGVQPDYNDIKTSKLILEKTIKAYVARNIIDNAGFYPIIADIDNTLQVAIDTISNL